jgi:hypothetical protein
MIPTVFASALRSFPRDKRADRRADHRPRRDARADHRPDHRRLSDRSLLLALAVSGQCRAGRIVTSRRRLDADRFRQAGLALLEDSTGGASPAWRAFLGALEYLLEEGPIKGWFEDEAIVVAAADMSAAGAVFFFWRAFTAPQPIVDLSRLQQPQFRPARSSLS